MSETGVRLSLAGPHWRAHRTMIEAVLMTGAVPTVVALAAQFEQSEELFRPSLVALAAAGAFATPPTPRLVIGE